MNLPISDFERSRRGGEENFGPQIRESTEDTYDLDDCFKESPEKESIDPPPSKPSSCLGEIFWGIVGFFFIFGFLIYLWIEDKF